MGESRSFTDALKSVTDPEDQREHTRAMTALQSELEYHLKAIGNNTYLDNAVSHVYDGGRSDSLHKIEITYEQEKANPNSVSREDVTKLVKEDQRTLYAGNHVSQALAWGATALVQFGGAKGKMVAGALITLNTMHPNDSVEKQVLEGVSGMGLSSLASLGWDKGASIKNPYLGTLLQGSSYSLAALVSSEQWPNVGSGRAPDVDNIYSKVTPTPNYFPSPNLKTTGEWSQFDLTKK